MCGKIEFFISGLYPFTNKLRIGQLKFIYIVAIILLMIFWFFVDMRPTLHIAVLLIVLTILMPIYATINLRDDTNASSFEFIKGSTSLCLSYLLIYLIGFSILSN